MQYDFIHHPDDRIVILGVPFSMEFWNVVEPDYELPDGYIGRLYTQGESHQLIRDGNSTQDQADVNDLEISNYVARINEYVVAWDAQQNGAYVYNDNGTIMISGPPSLYGDKGEIANDGVDTITIACDLGDNTATDEVRWSVIAPDGSIVEESDNAIDGVDEWELTTSHVGVHAVYVETDLLGSSMILFEGI